MSQAVSLPASPLVVGTKIAGRYLVHRVIGDGGMGTVFEVEHLSLGRRFALKVLLLRSSEDLVRRFEREARSLARINSPRVAQITDFGVDPIVGPFFVMELLEGETLEKRLKRTGAIPEEEAVEIAAEVFEGLQDVHDVGVIHRDIKPSNIGLMSRGPVRVKLIDFGLAVQLDPNPHDGITRSNQMVGTLLYMAPEQFRGQLPSPAMDLYAMGAVLYEMLAGTPPFIGHTAEAIMHQQLQAMPPAFATVAPNVRVSRWLEQVVQRLLEKRPEARYGSAQIVAHALRSRDPHATVGGTAPLPAASARPPVQSTPPQGSPSARQPARVPASAGLVSATHLRGENESPDDLAGALFGDARRSNAAARVGDAVITRERPGVRVDGEYDIDMPADDGPHTPEEYGTQPAANRTSRLLGGLPRGARLQSVRTSLIERTLFVANFWARTAFTRPTELVLAVADTKRPASERWLAGTLLCALLSAAVLIVGLILDPPWAAVVAESSAGREQPTQAAISPEPTAAPEATTQAAPPENVQRPADERPADAHPADERPTDAHPADELKVQAPNAPAVAAEPGKAKVEAASGEIRQADDESARQNRRAARHSKRDNRKAVPADKPRSTGRGAAAEKAGSWSGEIIETMKP